MSTAALQRAVLHHRQGQFEQARALYQRLLEREPGHLEALCLLIHPLFEIDRLRRHLECAFAAMIERSRAGEPPATFPVAAEA